MRNSVGIWNPEHVWRLHGRGRTETRSMRDRIKTELAKVARVIGLGTERHGIERRRGGREVVSKL